MPKGIPFAETPTFMDVLEEFKLQDINVLELMSRPAWTPDAINKAYYTNLARVPMNTPDGRTLAPIVVEAEAIVHRANRKGSGRPGISRR
jgi:hypothetical protein